MNKYHLITVGDVVIDAYLTIHEENSYVSLQNNKLCFNYGQKIPVESCIFSLGGNACNVAAGATRLEIKTALVAEIGDDEFSQKISSGLAKENIPQDFVTKTKSASSFSFGIMLKGERTLFVEHVKRAHEFNFQNIETDWVYLTSLGEDWRNAYQKTLEFVQQKNLRLAFNPGTLQIENGELLKEILSKTYVLFLNKEEAQKISKYQILSADDIKNLLQNLKKLGPRTIVVTDGKNGSYCLDENGDYFFAPVKEAKIVGKTGVGDAYTSGFLAAKINSFNTEDAMSWGTINAAGVIGEIGAQTGLLNKEKLMSLFQSEKLNVQRI